MDKQKKQAICQMILAAILCAAAVIPGMVMVKAGTAKEQAAQTEQERRPIEHKMETVTAVAEPVEILYHYEAVPLDKALQDYIIRESEQKGIDPAIVMAMIERESDYKADTIGDNGDSYGLMQIQPRWHSERMERLGCTELLDPYQNVTVGIDYLAEKLDQYDGDMAKALVAYNQGSYKGTVTAYAKAVLEKAGELNAYTR